MSTAKACKIFSKNVAANQKLRHKIDKYNVAFSQRASHNRLGMLVYGLVCTFHELYYYVFVTKNCCSFYTTPHKLISLPSS